MNYIEDPQAGERVYVAAIGTTVEQREALIVEVVAPDDDVNTLAPFFLEIKFTDEIGGTGLYHPLYVTRMPALIQLAGASEE